jgi:hypothetical protein
VPRKADIPADLFFDEPAAKPKRAKKTEDADDKALKRQNAKPPKADPDVAVARIGRPPMQEGPKSPVTLYLTEPVLHRLEEARFLLLSEYGVKTRVGGNGKATTNRRGRREQLRRTTIQGNGNERTQRTTTSAVAVRCSLPLCR